MVILNYYVLFAFVVTFNEVKKEKSVFKSFYIYVIFFCLYL